jgi:Asp-tRNA(Asn)/Glu-tRNA(Gln) amidotransferase A subunit family amidase
MGRTAADVALLLEVIAGKDPLDPRQSEVPGATLRADAEQGFAGTKNWRIEGRLRYTCIRPGR